MGTPTTLNEAVIEVLWRRLLSIVDEVAVAVRKGAFSPIIRESNDYSCAIFDATGQLLVQNTYGQASHLGAMPNIIRHFFGAFPPETLREGDALLTNDPWIGTGHPPDFCVATPVFHRERVVAVITTIVHHVDVGGRMASTESREAYEEGLRIPICKVCDGGPENDVVIGFIRQNVRVPELVIGDLRAQITANHIGAGKIRALLGELAWDDLQALSDEIISRTEAAVRRAIDEVPDGVYHARYVTDLNDDRGEPIVYECRVTVAGSDIEVDWTGSSPQVSRAVNVVLNYTYAMQCCALKTALFPSVLNNAGCFRPIKIKAEEGSILHCRFPASTFHRMATGHTIPQAVFAALASVVPEKVAADTGSAPLWSEIFYGQRTPGDRFLVWIFFHGGTGATWRKDGLGCCIYPFSISNTPVEMFESDTRLLVEGKALLADSGGAGKFRGGIGQQVVIRVPPEPVGPHGEVTAALAGGRYRRPALGLLGGEPGSVGRIVLNGREELTSIRNVVLEAGDTIAFHTPGGGGYGDPADRDPEALARDVRFGYVSRRAARDVYRADERAIPGA